METFPALLAICVGNSLVTGGFPAQRPVAQNFDVFFDLRLNKRLSKQSRGWLFETPSRPLWHPSNGTRRQSVPHLCIARFNTLRPRRNGRRFADDTFKRIFLNENVRISIKISLKFVPKGPINNNPALIQIMAWRRSGDKPLSEPMMVSLLTHICVTRPQWVKDYVLILVFY